VHLIIPAGRQGRQSTAAVLSIVAIGGALVLGAASANASIGSPAGGSSDAILFGEVLNASGAVVASYAGDTGVSITSLANGTNTSRTALAGDANLAALFAADTSGDTLYWAVEGGQYGGSTAAAQIAKPGYAQFVTTTSGNSLSQLSGKTAVNLAHWASGLNNDAAALNANLNGQNSVEGASTAAAGLWDYNSPADLSGWYANGPLSGNTSLSATLYYVTGGGTTTSKLSTTVAGQLTLSASGLEIASGSAPVPDSYNLSTHKLTVPTLGIGSATYSNVVLTVGNIVSGPSGSAPNGSEDSYDPESQDLTVQSVEVGSGTYYNVVVSVSALDSIGSVEGGDSYAGGQLTIASVQVGSKTYTDVVITVAGIVGLANGMPQNALDIYEPSSGDLLIAAVTFQGKVYTNVTIKVGTIVSVNGNPYAATTELAGRPYIKGGPNYLINGRGE
jgi:hypothetical protein